MTNEELVELYQNGNNNVLEELISKNDGLVHLIARKFNTESIASIEYDDLIQEGRIGLMIAAGKYKNDLEVKAAFSTYAAFWIRQKISRFIKYKDTTKEISINRPVRDEENELELGDTLVSEEQGFCNVEDSVYYQQLHDELYEVMRERLTLRQMQIIEFRYGLGCKPYTLNELSEMFDITLERVRCIEKDSLNRMKNSNWGRRTMKERNIEAKEKILSPNTRVAFDDYVSINAGNAPIKDMLERLKTQRIDVSEILNIRKEKQYAKKL